MQDTTQDRVIQRLAEWAGEQASVRAMLLTSSRTNPNAPMDAFSDYDVILVTTDVHPFHEDDAWLEDFGKVLVVYRDPIRIEYGCERFARITQYEDGLKIDFTVYPLELLRRIVADPQLPADLDMGYAVLLDKDRLTDGLKPPTYAAYIPTPPTEKAYQTRVQVFFHEATYVAKHLWRDDLLPAKYNLDHAMKHACLRQMLEWRIEIDHDWSVKPGAYGKGLKKRLPPGLWAELESTYIGAGLEENWEAMFRTTDLFRQVAIQVADHLGYEYPYDLDRRAVRYLRKVKNLDRQAQALSLEES
jgi:aminoglycoside 6-adenylyltransferase